MGVSSVLWHVAFVIDARIDRSKVMDSLCEKLGKHHSEGAALTDVTA